LLVAHREVVNPSERFVDRALRNGHPRAKRLEIAIDRIFLQTHVPKLQSVRSGVPVSASTTRVSDPLVGQIGEAYVAEIHRWAKANGIPVRNFAKGDNKEKIAERLLRAAAEEGGDGKVVLIGIA